MKFLQIITPWDDGETVTTEIVRVDDIQKIFKGEGNEGTSIHYDVWFEKDGCRTIKRYVQEFITTEARDTYWREMIEYLGIQDIRYGLKKF